MWVGLSGEGLQGVGLLCVSCGHKRCTCSHIPVCPSVGKDQIKSAVVALDVPGQVARALELVLL